MTASINGLLAQAQRHLEPPADQRTAAIAITAIGHCGRALHELDLDGIASPTGTPEAAAAVARLATVCRAAAAAWPATSGRTETLTGAAADIIARRSPQLDPGQRWATAIAVSETTLRCTEFARTFAPYQSLPALVAVHAAVGAVEQAAALEPPARLARAVLDHPIPVAAISPGMSPLAAAAAAAPALTAAVHAAVARSALTISELLACAAAAETAAQHATHLAQTLAAPGQPKRTVTAAGYSWRAVQHACAPFDDGTKARPEPSPVIAWADRLVQALHDEFGPPTQRGTLAPAAPELARLATGIRAIANQLPEMASYLQRAAATWGSGPHLLARERNLPSYEERPARSAGERVVFASRDDLDDLQITLTDAAHLSVALARELHRTSGTVGRQVQPHLAATFTTAIDNDTNPITLGRRAIRSERNATANATQWGFGPRRPPEQRPR